MGVSASLIRYYANKGLLAVVRNHLGQRVIERREVERLKAARNGAWAAPRKCVYCGTTIDQTQTFCQRAACTQRRWRLRAKRSYHAKKKGATVTDRGQHLAWAKGRALRVLDEGDVSGAFTTFSRDLGKHDALARELQGAIAAGGRELLVGFLDQPDQMRRWIEGFH